MAKKLFHTYVEKDELVLAVRISQDMKKRISLSMSKQGLSAKKRSEWFRRAILSLNNGFIENEEYFLSSLGLYWNNEPSKPIPVYLVGESRAAFLEMEKSGEKGLADAKGLRTRILVMAAHLAMIDDGSADMPSIKIRR